MMAYIVTGIFATFTLASFATGQGVHDSSRPNGQNIALNPINRVLSQLKQVYGGKALCANNPFIRAECDACSTLGVTTNNQECCKNIAAFEVCHSQLIDLLESIGEGSRRDMESMLENEEYFPLRQDNAVDKRYGSVFSKWSWSPSWYKNSRKSKRYGTVFGKTNYKINKPWWWSG